MGSYHCQTPTYTNPSRVVEGLACRFAGATCPESTRAFDFPGPRPTPAVTITKCVPSSYLLSGSAGGVRRAAVQQASTSFAVRVVGRAGPEALNYQTLISTCSGAMVRRAWYTDLHPRGMPCSACDSHQYWVQLRSGAWATLGYFNG